MQLRGLDQILHRFRMPFAQLMHHQLVHAKARWPKPMKKLCAAAHAAGVIVLSCGTYGNILRFLPPLTISDELLLEGLDVLALILADL